MIRAGTLGSSSSWPMAGEAEPTSFPTLWTPAALTEALGHGTFSCRDMSARAVQPPPLMLSVPGLQPDVAFEWAQFLRGVHGVDRSVLLRAWSAALHRPGQPQTFRIRQQRSSSWWERECVFLNVFDAPEIGALLWVVRDIAVIESPGDSGADPRVITSGPLWHVQHLDQFGRVLRCDGFSREIIGVDRSEMIGAMALLDVHPVDHELLVGAWPEVLHDAGATRTVVLRLVNQSSGSADWFEMTITNRLADPDVAAVVAHSYNIEQRRAQEAGVVAGDQQFRMLADDVPVAVFRVDSSGLITYGNDRFREAVGDGDRFIGFADAAFETWWDDVIRRSDSVEAVVRLGKRTVKVRGRAHRNEAGPDSDVDSSGLILGVIGSFEDITAEALRSRLVDALAHSDQLTGLPDRIALEQVLDDAIIGDESFVILSAGLDRFEAVADVDGPHIRDEVVIEVSRRLAQAVRPGDLVARIADEEFVLVCRGVDDSSLADLIERVRSTASKPLELETDYRVSISIGSARPAAGDDGADLLQRANVAMRNDKRRNDPSTSG